MADFVRGKCVPFSAFLDLLDSLRDWLTVFLFSAGSLQINSFLELRRFVHHR
jgi:hypothetical protein